MCHLRVGAGDEGPPRMKNEGREDKEIGYVMNFVQIALVINLCNMAGKKNTEILLCGI
jgi:hypothetical protein